MTKSVAYNWLVSDANCHGDYWIFIPEDCHIHSLGWTEVQRHMLKGKECFALSKDPKALVGRRGIFRALPQEIQVLCDMNFLGKEIASAILRGQLDRRGFYCITKNWRRISVEPQRYGNELYEEMNVSGHPDINRKLSLPIFQDYGLDGWKASQTELEAVFMKIVTASLERQRQDAEKAKSIISHYGPLITEVPCKGLLQEFWERMRHS